MKWTIAFLVLCLLMLACNSSINQVETMKTTMAVDSIFQLCQSCHRYNRKDVSEIMLKAYSDSIQKFKHDYLRSQDILSHKSIKITETVLDSIYGRIQIMKLKSFNY